MKKEIKLKRSFLLIFFRINFYTILYQFSFNVLLENFKNRPNVLVKVFQSLKIGVYRNKSPQKRNCEKDTQQNQIECKLSRYDKTKKSGNNCCEKMKVYYEQYRKENKNKMNVNIE